MDFSLHDVRDHFPALLGWRCGAQKFCSNLFSKQIPKFDQSVNLDVFNQLSVCVIYVLYNVLSTDKSL